MTQKQQRKCPICDKPAAQKSKHFPFCGERCRTIDLGNWASEAYVAHSPVTEVDELLDAIRKQSSDD